MQSRKNRVIIDTNLWISFLLTKNHSYLDTIIADKLVTLLFSRQLLEEFIEVAQRDKFKKYFESDDLKELLLKVNARAIFVPVKSVTTLCRDAKDNFLLSLAVDGKATHLITGDKDLLILKRYKKTNIPTLAQYLSEFKV
jgi:uncharacterized protein